MAESDFIHYGFSDITGDFVVPKLHCDPYMGLLVPQEGQFTRAILHELSETLPLPANAVAPVTGKVDAEWGRQQRMARELELPIHKEHTEVILPLAVAEPDEWGSCLKVYEVARAMERLGPQPKSWGGTGRREAKDHMFSTGVEGRPLTPTLRVLDWFVLRSHVWVPGEPRESATGDLLEPVFNASKQSVVVMASATVRFLAGLPSE